MRKKQALRLHDGMTMVTKRKTVEEDLQRVHEEAARHLAQMKAVFDSMTAGLVVSDLEGRVFHWNRAALAMHGFASIDECRRQLSEFRTIFELVELDGKVVPFEHWPLMRIFQGEDLKNWELRIVRLESDWQRIYAYSGTLARGVNGEPLLAVLNIDDITERKHNEETLQRFKLIVDNSRDIILFIRRSDGCILDANLAASKAYGYSHAELLNLTIFDLRATNTLDQAAIQLSIADDQGLLFETIHRRKDGSTFAVGVSSQGSSSNGERTLVSVIRDITQKKRYEEELLQARRDAEAASLAKSQFLASMSHEIRTPMTVFLGALEHLQQLDRNPQRRQLLALADQAAQRLHALIDDILDFSRIEANRIDIEDEPYDLHECLLKIANMMSSMASEKKLALELDLAPDVPVCIVGDQYRLEQVLLNLLNNAIKFTEKGEVRISVNRDGGDLIFSVSDTGFGVPEDKHDLIFQAFSQVDSSSTRRFGGTGLGLAISRRLVELMGGKLWLRSNAGGGSVFLFTLPLSLVSQPERTPDCDLSKPVGQKFLPAKILLVEDNPQVRDIVLAMLFPRQWTAVAVANGLEAVRTWQDGDFDVILMDLQMPEMDGLEATRRIRALAAASQEKVFILGLTAHAAVAVRDECLAAGMDDVLVKPFETAKLLTSIEKGLATGQQP